MSEVACLLKRCTRLALLSFLGPDGCRECAVSSDVRVPLEVTELHGLTQLQVVGLKDTHRWQALSYTILHEVAHLTGALLSDRVDSLSLMCTPTIRA